jgi:hypothetical protein
MNKQTKDIIETDAKIVETETVKPLNENQNFKQGITSHKFGLKSLVTALFGIVTAVFSFLFFGVLILFVFALPALAFLLLHIFKKTKR